MERKKYFAIVIGLILLCNSIGLGQSPRKKIYDAYINGDMKTWRRVMLEFAETQPRTIEQKLELVSYYYGYTAWHIGNEKGKQALNYIAAAENILDDIIFEKGIDIKIIATAHAYKGAFIGYKIGLYPLKAPFLGPKSVEHTEQAFELDPNNIQAYIDFGNSLFYRPGILGGDKSSAIIHYKRAVQLFEEQKEVAGDWSYLNLLSILGQALDEVEKVDEALEIYEKVLRIEPDFKWVRDELLPTLKKKMHNPAH